MRQMTKSRKKRDLDDWGLIIALSLAIGAALLLTRSVWAAAPDPSQVQMADKDPELILARALVAEAGYRPQRDHTAILHVLRRRGGDSLRAQARLAVSYCSVFKPSSKPTRHRFLVSNADWPYLRRSAPAVTRLVRAWARGVDVPDPCGGQAVHWGSPDDMQLRSIDPAVHVDCGGTRNVFLSEWRQL
jgi:hypothetical protein